MSKLAEAIKNVILMGAPEGPVYCHDPMCVWAEVEKIIAAHDAAIRAECAERAMDFIVKHGIIYSVPNPDIWVRAITKAEGEG